MVDDPHDGFISMGDYYRAHDVMQDREPEEPKVPPGAWLAPTFLLGVACWALVVLMIILWAM